VRDSRQQQVHEWCAAAFGAEHATSIPHRAIRMCEEAIEACQAAGGARSMVHRLVDYVFDRPAGELAQEIGGVGITLLTLAQAAGMSADAEEVREFERVLAKPLEHFRERNEAKNDAGSVATGNSFSQNKAIRATFPSLHNVLTDPLDRVDRLEKYGQPFTAEHRAELRNSIIETAKALQRDTINTLADCLVREAARLESTNDFVRFEDLKREAQALRDYAETLAPAAPEVNR
jgi:hypothetical protein